MEKNYDLSFGIDLGIASVGWSVFNLKENKILDKGVYLYSEAEKSEDRRISRGVRRRKNRKLHRIERLNILFNANGIVVKNTYDSNLLEKRLLGIKEKITMQDIVNIIMYFARHRGYIPFKDEDERKSEIVDELRKQGLLACQIQEQIFNGNSKYRGDEYLIQHSDYVKELKTMLYEQKKYYQEINEEFINDVIEIINSKRRFWEGPGGPRENQLNKYGRYRNLEDLEKYNKDKNYNKYLFENLIGNCNIYANEKKASAWNFYAESFNFFNDMTNLKINIQDLDETNRIYFEKVDKETYKLKNTAIETLKDNVLNSSSVSYPKLFKKLFLVDFSKIYGYKKDKNGNPELAKFEQIRKLKNKLEDAKLIEELFCNMDAYNKAIYLIQVSPDKQTRYEILKDNLEEFYSDRLIELLSSCSLENRYNSFSEKALKKYLELMEEYNQNSSYIERKFSDEINATREEELINSYISENIEKGNLKYINSKGVEDIVASPATKKSLRKAISIINKLFSKYGYPGYICIENTRELLSTDKQKEYENKTLDNNRKRETAKKKLEEAGYEVSEVNIDKYLLLNETNHKCAYCNKDITVSNCEIEHILPRSKTANDTFLNKTVSCTQCNSLKNNRTPYEFLTSQNMYEDFKNRVKKNSKFDDKKKDNLLFEGNIDKYEKNFKNRNLNDTAYATNELANQVELFKKAYMKHNYGEILDTKVLKIPGQFTGIIRRKAKLDKNRDFKYHHAVDASIIASMPYLRVAKLIDMVQNEQNKYWQINNLSEYRDNLYEELYLNKQLKEELQKSDYSNTRFAQEIQKKKNGQLFDANISKVVIKNNEYYKVEQIDNIYDLDYKDIEKYFTNSKTKKYFLCKDNDPKLYKKIYDIIEMYQEQKVNPFVEYCKENNMCENEKFDYRKYGIRKNQNSPVVAKLRFLTKVNTPYIMKNDKLIISQKQNKKAPMIMFDSLKQYCTRIYRDKESGKLLFMPILRIFVDNNSGEIRTDSDYYKVLFDTYVGKEEQEVEKYMDLFNNEYVRFYKNGEVLGEGLVSYFHKTHNIIIIKNCNASINKKVDTIEKIKSDILGLYNLNI